MAPTLEEMRLACANADTDSNRFEKPIASNASASSPARSDDSEVYTQVELEAWEDTLEVTSNSAGDKRAPSSKPKPSSGSVSSSTEEGDKGEHVRSSPTILTRTTTKMARARKSHRSRRSIRRR